MSVRVILAILAGLTASALTRFSEGLGPADTYTGGFIHWLRYSGFDFGVIAAGIVWLVVRKSPKSRLNRGYGLAVLPCPPIIALRG